MKTVGVIPARMASTRFPCKVLAKIGGKPMIQWVWEKARGAKRLDEIMIACDHQDVLAAARSFGAIAVMTNPAHPSGTDRIAEAIGQHTCDIIINIQGDEPFIDVLTIDSLAHMMQQDSAVMMGTVVKAIISKEEFENPNVVKCVLDENGYALYFSRAPIPYQRDQSGSAGLRYKHLGLYGYRKDFLMQYKNWPKSTLEGIEQLEQLRVLEKGYRIKTVVTEYESIAIDTPDDLRKAEAWLQKQSN